ncbi:enamine deaminase RidA (YjgF/YER057c/UK114 family) [Luteibacter sp. W1I16]|uniref:RidA family protein n=1 Tax=Luteibacter sp. W1I16 TaxID=3373922 RepID=UPI003D1A4095
MLKQTLIASLLIAAITPALAADVVRHKIPNSNFPISAAVEVPAGKTLVFLSGVVPPVADANAPKDSPQSYGDTKTQTVGVLTSIEKQLKGMGLSMDDVVKMQVFLVGDPAKGGKMDFAGFMAGYTQFFGTATQPNLPSRSAMQVAALASPNFLVEIEVTAVRP